MSWGCYKHEVDVNSDSWNEKEMELSIRAIEPGWCWYDYSRSEEHRRGAE